MTTGKGLDVARGFLVTAAVYIIIGMGIGIGMGATENFAMKGAHVHANLVGFVLMTLFALTYHCFPAMAGSRVAQAQFWVFQLGAFLMNGALVLMLSGLVSEARIVPVLVPGELLVLAGMLLFGWLVLRNAHKPQGA